MTDSQAMAPKALQMKHLPQNVYDAERKMLSKFFNINELQQILRLQSLWKKYKKLRIFFIFFFT